MKKCRDESSLIMGPRTDLEAEGAAEASLRSDLWALTSSGVAKEWESRGSEGRRQG